MTMRLLEFVRPAHPTDTHGQPSATLWRDAEGEHIWLLPGDVIQAGLTEKMREGLATFEQTGWIEHSSSTRQSDDTPLVTSGEVTTPSVLGGHTEDWQWQFVQDGTELFVAIDNKPSVERAAAEMRPTPAFYSAVLPMDVLQVVAGQAA